LIERERVVAMSGVPVMARELINHPDFATRDTSSLMSLAGGGAQLPPDLVHKIDAAVKTARPGTGYGMTETCGIITSVGGFIFIVDRKKDMVLRGGENVYCAEVEGALYHHPAVAECSVFGVPDERLGEEVGAAIVLQPGETVTAADLRAHCEPIIARHKIP